MAPLLMSFIDLKGNICCLKRFYIAYLRKYCVCYLQYVYTKVSMPSEKSWIFFVKFSGPGKSWKMGWVLEILVQGPGKSWNFLGYDVGGGHNDAGANLCLSMDTQNIKGIELQMDFAP